MVSWTPVTNSGRTSRASKGALSMDMAYWLAWPFNLCLRPLNRPACLGRSNHQRRIWFLSWPVLTRPPYESIKLSTEKDLSLKTSFLLALASSKWVNELQGLKKKDFIMKTKEVQTRNKLSSLPNGWAGLRSPSCQLGELPNYPLC